MIAECDIGIMPTAYRVGGKIGSVVVRCDVAAAAGSSRPEAGGSGLLPATNRSEIGAPIP